MSSTRIIPVGIAEMKIGRSADSLRTTLGSCIGITIYDPEKKIGALCHIMLAVDGSKGRESLKSPYKYGETALPLMFSAMEKEGSKQSSWSVRIFGGSSMFKNLNNSNFLQNIGEQNTQFVKKFFLDRKIPIVFEDTGGAEGRTITLHIEDGRILIKKGGSEKYIYKVK
jgi:chemotaxis protein CheD